MVRQAGLLPHLALGALAVSKVSAAGYRTVGSSGCTVQMAFLPPYTDTVVFLDNYHRNFGGPGVNLQTGAHSPTPFKEADGRHWAFGVEYSWRNNDLRILDPVSNTFCSSGAFFPNGTMVNPAGAELYAGDAVPNEEDGRQSVRYYQPGPCPATGCTMDFQNHENALQSRRWYPTAQSLVNGDVVVVGGSDVGLLVTNEAAINVPSYEILKADGSTPPNLTEFDFLYFDAAENQTPNKSYNLYPVMHMLPNKQGANHIFTVAANQAIVWDYSLNKQIKALPDTPLQPRTFPSSATIALLPLSAGSYHPTILMCGGSSGDIPLPQALDDCYTINPNDDNPVWTQDDNLPNGGQTMTDATLLPDGTVLLTNGAHVGCAGGYMARDPVTQALIYNPKAALGSRFTVAANSTIPRLYHSVSILLPSGEVLIAGSNPDVFYTPYGNASSNRIYPEFYNYGQISYLHQQAERNVNHPTEYRVEIFSPSYMDSPSRPAITFAPAEITYGSKFNIIATGLSGRNGTVTTRLSYSGFRTHAIDMGQRMVEMKTTISKGQLVVTAPANPSVMTPGHYLLWVVNNGIPSEAQWISLQAQ